MKTRIIALLVATLCLPLLAQRLPRFVLPQHYDLTITPDLAAERFAGVARISVGVQQPVTSIRLNAAEIEFGNVTVESAGKAQKASVTTDAKEETATLSFAEPLAIGPATLNIAYNGVLNRQLRGFYIGQSGGKKYVASQMEATDARRAFPGFDEPDMKATFRLTVIADEGHNVITNAPQESVTPGPAGKKTVRFATTPRLSTYHIALIVGDFECLSDSQDGIPIRICATPDKVHLGRFSVQATKEILAYFNRYFEIPYPFQKLDQIALADFAAGAMENPGAVTYRERILLSDDKTASIDTLRGSAGTNAHELAHMWFGDLVTMRWWDDIWLNEGFASWMGRKAVEAMRPEWKNETADASATGGPIRTDVLITTRPIHKSAETPDEIDQLFDSVAYGKTAALLRMLESYVGEEKFREGINLYLRRNAYSNASASDFAAALNDATGHDVAEVLASYVNQPGVPLVTVSSRCEGGQTVADLKQERFLVRGDARAKTAGQLWVIPVCFRDGECVVLRERQQTFRLSGCRAPLFANANGRGYYLTGYADGVHEEVARKPDVLSPSERVALLRDQWYLVQSGRESIADYLDLAMAFARDRALADTVLSNVWYAERHLADAQQRPMLQARIRTIAEPLARELGWAAAPSDTAEDRELRQMVLRVLADPAADAPTRRRARDLALKSLKAPASVDPSIASTVVTMAALAGDARLYDAYLHTYRTTTDLRQKGRMLSGLSAFRDPNLLRRTLQLTLTDDIRSQDMGGVLAGVIANPAGTELGWQFVEQNWPAIEKKLPPGGARGIIGAVAAQACDPVWSERIQRFVSERKIVQARQATAQTLERIASCVDLRNAQRSNLAEWLARHAKPMASR